jgi:hypothetical protein
MILGVSYFCFVKWSENFRSLFGWCLIFLVFRPSLFLFLIIHLISFFYTQKAVFLKSIKINHKLMMENPLKTQKPKFWYVLLMWYNMMLHR